MGVTLHGTSETLGLWVEQTEGAKFWPKVHNDLKFRVELYSTPSH